MKYYVNDSCIGCGMCVGTCSEVFHMTDAEILVFVVFLLYIDGWDSVR